MNVLQQVVQAIHEMAFSDVAELLDACPERVETKVTPTLHRIHFWQMWMGQGSRMYGISIDEMLQITSGVPQRIAESAWKQWMAVNDLGQWTLQGLAKKSKTAPIQIATILWNEWCRRADLAQYNATQMGKHTKELPSSISKIVAKKWNEQSIVRDVRSGKMARTEGVRLLAVKCEMDHLQIQEVLK